VSGPHAPPPGPYHFRTTRDVATTRAGCYAVRVSDDLSRRAYEAFAADASRPPATSLRGADALDGYREPPPFDPAVDEPTDAYLEAYTFWGHAFLDPASWRHYLPRLIDYALRHLAEPGLPVVEGLLYSLRPPERDPPRFGPLTREQESVIVAVLDLLAFDETSAYRDDAMQVLEEYWVPNALYRESPPRE
jgi:hypothetical protein